MRDDSQTRVRMCVRVRVRAPLSSVLKMPEPPKQHMQTSPTVLTSIVTVASHATSEEVSTITFSPGLSVLWSTVPPALIKASPVPLNVVMQQP